MEAQSECLHVAYMFLTFGADLHAQSVLINKISASELRQKFIKSALLVGSASLKNFFLVINSVSFSCSSFFLFPRDHGFNGITSKEEKEEGDPKIHSL